MKGVMFVGDQKLELRDFPDPTAGRWQQGLGFANQML
jgi:hypothetical protein